ncbi:MAG: FHA domain-containing protein [Verrucomicrobiota bacterium]
MKSDFGEILLKYCLRKLSGCFIVESKGNRGIIYLIEGLVVHSEVNKLTGLPAFLQFFTWPSPERFEWTLNMGAKEQTMALSYEAVVVMISYAETVTIGEDNHPELVEDEPYDHIDLALEIMQGDKPFQYPIKTKQVRVGRSSANDLVLEDPSVSRKHAFLTLFQDGLVVHDIGSSNGTFIEQEAISLCKLERNQYIFFGHVRCKLIETPNSQTLKASKAPRMVTKTTRIPVTNYQAKEKDSEVSAK